MSVETIGDFYLGAAPFVETFNSFARTRGLEILAGADHLCYKCGTGESFERMRAMFERNSEYIYQSIISGRRIAYVKLSKPLETALGAIRFLELSDQKPDGSQVESYDHIEAFPRCISYDDLVAHLSKTDKVIKVERPHHTTHDIDMDGGFLFRCTRGPLVEKIRSDEMN